MKDDNLCQNVFNLLTPALIPNSYDNLNNMKLDLNVSSRSVYFRANNQGL